MHRFTIRVSVAIVVGFMLLTGCHKRPKLEERVALEIIGVIGYSERPQLPLADIETEGRTVEDYSSLVLANLPQGEAAKNLDIRSALAHEFLKWGRETDARKLLLVEARNLETSDSWFDLKLFTGVLVHEPESKAYHAIAAKNEWRPLIFENSLIEAVNGKYQAPISDLINRYPTSRTDPRWLSYAATFLRGSTISPETNRDFMIERDLSQCALQNFLAKNSWEQFIEIYVQGKESLNQTRAFESLVWVVGSRLEIEKRHGDSVATATWEKIMDDLLDASKKRNTKDAVWVKYVRDEYFRAGEGRS